MMPAAWCFKNSLQEGPVDDLAALGDRHPVRLGIGDGPNDEAFDLRARPLCSMGVGVSPILMMGDSIEGQMDLVVGERAASGGVLRLCGH